VRQPERDDDVVVSARTLVRAIVEVRKLGRQLMDFGERLTHLERVVTTAGLNGHSEDIRTLAQLAPEIKRRMADPHLLRLTEMVEQSQPTMEKFISMAPGIIAAFEQAQARATFWRTLMAYLRPVRHLINAFLFAVVAAAAYILVHQFLRIGPSVP